MGRIKTTFVRRTARQLVEKISEAFGEGFEKNKKALGSNVLPSKRVRNMVAGQITRIHKNIKKSTNSKKLNEDIDDKDDNKTRQRE